MIPKKIHYCWFGKGKMPMLSIKCIDSWKEFLPDYELKLWDETNFDVNTNVYVQEAYAAKKYAFVSDYVRLYALDKEGGIYMDTDVQVLKNLDYFLQFPAFTGFETDTEVPTGIIASEKNGSWVKDQLTYYENKNFILPDGSLDLTTNVQIISKRMSENGFVVENGYQIYKDCMHVFPKDYFCPKNRVGKIELTENSYCIHHFNGSWMSPKLKFKKFFYHKILGSFITGKLVNLKRKLKKQN